MNYKEITDNTNDIVKNHNYQVGDIFQEMYHFWLYIVSTNGKEVTTFESNGRDLSDFLLKIQTKEELSKRLKYTSIDGCWVDYHKNDIVHMNGLLDKYKEIIIQSGDIAKIRDMNLNLTLS
jgi:hypothetical protein